MERFADMGYEVVLGPNVYKNDGVGKSTDAASCGAEINDFFMNDRSDIIISAGGGETMFEDLPFVDFKGIAAADPKWFIGYSDNTNLVMPLATLSDTASIYGPCLSSFGMSAWHKSVEDAFDIMSGDACTSGNVRVSNYDGFELDFEKPVCEDSDREPTKEEMCAPYNINMPFDMKIYAPEGGADVTLKQADKAEFSGRLLGGCLDCLSLLCGSKYDAVARDNKEYEVEAFNERYKEDGVIWFIEACELNPIGVRRILSQLADAGWFDKAKGFIIGRPMLYGQDFFGLTHYEAVTGVLGRYGVPIVMDVDLGHLPPMMPLICGAKAQVVAQAGTFAIDMSLE